MILGVGSDFPVTVEIVRVFSSSMKNDKGIPGMQNRGMKSISLGGERSQSQEGERDILVV